MRARTLLGVGCAYAFIAAPASIDDAEQVVGCLSSCVTKLNKREQCVDAAHREVSFEEEYAFGGTLAVRMVGELGLVRDAQTAVDSPALQVERYVNLVGRNLGAQSGRPNDRWTFGVLEEDPKDSAIRAFSTPGGYVFVSKTLLKRLDNEAQLAAVLAHEIAHVTEGHAIHQYQDVKASLCNTTFGTSLLEGPIADSLDLMIKVGSLVLDDEKNAKTLAKLTDDLASDVFNAGYSKPREFDADRIGAQLMIYAGYNPYEMILFLNRVPVDSAVLRNHPENKERQDALRAWIKGYCASPDNMMSGDCPFTNYPSVQIPKDIKAAIAKL